VKFSSVCLRKPRPNALSQLLSAKRRAGTSILDLTESNPTHAAIQYPAGFLAALSHDDAARYEPEPFGLLPRGEK